MGLGAFTIVRGVTGPTPALCGLKIGLLSAKVAEMEILYMVTSLSITSLSRLNTPHSIGAKDAALRTPSRSKALSHITWGAGREVTPNAVQAALTMYDKVNPLPGVEVLIHESFGMWGRSSPFEEPTRLSHSLKAGVGEEVLWVLQTIIEEKKHEKIISIDPDDFADDM